MQVQDGRYLPAAVIAVWAEKFMQDLGLRGGVGMYRAHHTYIHVDARGWGLRRGSAATRGGVSGQGGRFCLSAKGTKGAGGDLDPEEAGDQADGIFGAKTERAVREFQKKNAGIAADGIFGRRPTARWGTIKGACCRGDDRLRADGDGAGRAGDAGRAGRRES